MENGQENQEQAPMADEPTAGVPQGAQPENDAAAAQEPVSGRVAELPNTEQTIAQAKQALEYLRAACQDPAVASAVADMWWSTLDASDEIGESPAEYLAQAMDPNLIESGEAEVTFKLAISLGEVTLGAHGYDEQDTPKTFWK